MNYGSLSEKTKRMIEKMQNQQKDERFILFGFDRKAAYLQESLWAYSVRYCMNRKEENLHGTLYFYYNEKGLVSIHTDDPITEEEKAYMENSLKTIPGYVEMIQNHTEYVRDVLRLLKSDAFEISDLKDTTAYQQKVKSYTFTVTCEECVFEGLLSIDPTTLEWDSYQLSQKEELGFDKAFEVSKIIKKHKPELFQHVFNKIRLILITES